MNKLKASKNNQSDYSSFELRFLAWLIDALILIGINYAAVILLSTTNNDLGLGYDKSDLYLVELLLPVFLPFIYYVCTESTKSQGTWGKIFYGLEVRDLKGKKASLWRLLIRFGVRSLYFWIPILVTIGLVIYHAQVYDSQMDSEGFGYVFWDFFVFGPVLVLGIGVCCLTGYSVRFFNPGKQTLHDLIAGTVVVKKVKEAPSETVASVPLSQDP